MEQKAAALRAMANDPAADDATGFETSRRLICGDYLGEISALAFLPFERRSVPLLLAGTGSQVLVYNIERGKLLCAFQVFEGIRVHGISLRPTDFEAVSLSLVSEFLIAVYGERRVKIFMLRVDAELNGGVVDNAVVKLDLVKAVPGFDHWVLDTCFLNEDKLLAVGLSDNSVILWDLIKSNEIARVKSSERCLLYSMRMWGDSVNVLLVASGTIFNEIIVWKLISESEHPSSSVSMESYNSNISNPAHIQSYGKTYVATHLNRLIGHEGSIFRLAWSSDGKKLMSASDDRSARIWAIQGERKECHDDADSCRDHVSASLTLYGHNARIWDCYLSDSVVITAGEDCTCRAWRLDGSQLMVLKEHIGRGIWRCIYDPRTSLLLTGGFDSAIKVHQLHQPPTHYAKEEIDELHDLNIRREVSTLGVPKVTKHLNILDSKSEYVRCIHFTHERILYVATNNGYLYRAEIYTPQDVRWTEITQLNQELPVICMDLLSMNSSESYLDMEDIIALGDGKGNVTIIGLSHDDHTCKISSHFSWPAEKERQLLGIYWCKSLGYRYIFTSDPRGTLKLWKLDFTLEFDGHKSKLDSKVSLLTVFMSSIGQRIMCVDASIKEKIVLCGDKRGNITVFPLLETLMLTNNGHVVERISYLKGAHGISSVNSICIVHSDFNHIEIRTTGGDGCICYFKYDKKIGKLEFTGMKQVKELSTIEYVLRSANSEEMVLDKYAVGFTSADFIIWDLTNETKIMQTPCGGWRRPYSYYLGAAPTYQNCFAFLKDHTIHVNRLWERAEDKSFPQSLHMQYHGREIHSMCFVCPGLESESEERHLWVATGCEDGSVRLTRYSRFGMEKWSESKLLGEHVGGSAVRSICFIPTIHDFRYQNCEMSGNCNHNSTYSKYDQFLLISVGSKRVLTSWVLRNNLSKDLNASEDQISKEPKHVLDSSRCQPSSISFQWLSTYMQPKFPRSYQASGKLVHVKENGYDLQSDGSSRLKPEPMVLACDDNDWRYMAVTAFLLRHVDSRLNVCFMVVACSDATLVLRALLLPYRLWFDVALLVPTNSLVLSLQHIVVTRNSCSTDITSSGDAYIAIGGSTNGSITFWDLTDSIKNFMQLVLNTDPQMLGDCQSRPQTGRGSQGGRWWKSSRSSSKRTVGKSQNMNENVDYTNERGSDTTIEDQSVQLKDPISNSLNNKSIQDHIPQVLSRNFSPEVVEVHPFYILKSVHQSGVNCLHVSVFKEGGHKESELAYCLVSGGDDQSLHCLGFKLAFQAVNPDSECSQVSDNADFAEKRVLGGLTSGNVNKFEVLFQRRIASAHNSAVKGVWTDGIWAFSTGLDQRIRCWRVSSYGQLTEHAHLISSVPEPEALSAIISDSTKNSYHIAVAGRGMQMVEFIASPSDE